MTDQIKEALPSPFGGKVLAKEDFDAIFRGALLHEWSEERAVTLLERLLNTNLNEYEYSDPV